MESLGSSSSSLLEGRSSSISSSRRQTLEVASGQPSAARRHPNLATGPQGSCLCRLADQQQQQQLGLSTAGRFINGQQQQ